MTGFQFAYCGHKFPRLFIILVFLIGGVIPSGVFPARAASQYDLLGPAGSGQFGTTVTVLPNGNFVVTDPQFSTTTTAKVGAAYLYNGATLALISTLTGSTEGDQVGLGGVELLTNGNYVVISYYWDNGGVDQAGAVTWCSAAAGCSGAVSPDNSLVGGHSQDHVGSPSVTVLTNGNYVVSSAAWDHGNVVDAGAITWCDGDTGCTGAVSADNSLVGLAKDDFCTDVIGWERVFPLPNGDYVADNFCWNDGSKARVGAVTWCDGTAGCRGTVSSANSLIGSTEGDEVGGYGIFPLTNGNYVVSSSRWDRNTIVNAGAVTWCNGGTGCQGVVSLANSLVGSTGEDLVGEDGVTALTNGNYVVSSSEWDHAAIINAGAATWCNGASGCKGEITTGNSLVGMADEDTVASYGVIALSNGNYVVNSPSWDQNASVQDVGAVTWGNGATGTVGLVSAANSLTGSTSKDFVGSPDVFALDNGNYVACSIRWHNGAVIDAGAATLGNGVTGTTGVVGAGNSLVGSAESDFVCNEGVTALTNGRYVVMSQNWHNGANAAAGAATWCAATGCTGPISPGNSLVGAGDSNRVGYGGAALLANGNYVVISPMWDQGGLTRKGAVTWCSGAAGCKGEVSPANSFTGASPADQIGMGGVIALPTGDYVMKNYRYMIAGVPHGAVTWAPGDRLITGTVTAENSVIGTAPNCGLFMAIAFDPVNNQLLVGRRCDNRVTIFKTTTRDTRNFLPLVMG